MKCCDPKHQEGALNKKNKDAATAPVCLVLMTRLLYGWVYSTGENSLRGVREGRGGWGHRYRGWSPVLRLQPEGSGVYADMSRVWIRSFFFKLMPVFGATYGEEQEVMSKTKNNRGHC